MRWFSHRRTTGGGPRPKNVTWGPYSRGRLPNKMLDHMKITDTSLQTDNHAGISSLIFFTGWMLFQQCQSTEVNCAQEERWQKHLSLTCEHFLIQRIILFCLLFVESRHLTFVIMYTRMSLGLWQMISQPRLRLQSHAAWKTFVSKNHHRLPFGRPVGSPRVIWRNFRDQFKKKM